MIFIEIAPELDVLHLLNILFYINTFHTIKCDRGESNVVELRTAFYYCYYHHILINSTDVWTQYEMYPFCVNGG